MQSTRTWLLAVLVGIALSSALPALSSASVQSQASVTFQRVVIDDAPLGADCKALGDLNGDGLLDIIVADNSGTPLQWYAAPNWTKQVIDSRSLFTTNMQTGDVDADGDTDIIIPDFISKIVVWYRNPLIGGGEWTANPIGAGAAHDIEIGDIDIDGSLDVAIRGHNGPTTLFLQREAGAWTRVDVKTAPAGEGLALGDLDNDGDLDLVGNGYWLEAPNDPTNGAAWTKRVFATSWARRVSANVGDLNDDGRLDIILANSESVGRLAWYAAPENPKTGKWVEREIDPSLDYVHYTQIADMDNDGDLDIAFAEMQQSKHKRVGVYWNPGADQTWHNYIMSNSGSHNIRVGDLDSDSDVDVIGANFDGDSPLELWRNDLITGQATQMRNAWSYIPVDTRRANKAFGLALGDINADGYDDIASGPYVYRNPGGHMATRWTRVALPNDVDAIAIVEIDGDQFGDIIAQKLPDIYWLEATDPQGDGWAATLIGAAPATDHVNGQGYAVGRLGADGPAAVFVAAGDGIYAYSIPEDPSIVPWPRIKVVDRSSAEGFALGDIDGDGDADIAGSVDGYALAWWENTGAGAWKAYIIGQTEKRGDRAAIADVNGDALPDIVVSEETPLAGAKVYWFAQPPQQQDPWARTTIVEQFTTNSLDVADMDRDGDVDIITGEHRGTRKVAVWENQGAGAFTERIVSRGKESHLGARVSDLDHDGDLEIVSIAWDSYPFLHLWRNDAARLSADLPVGPPYRTFLPVLQEGKR